ncbi:MAG TPA: DUF3078 domain-containing protein [Cyclobacteriaceae bacterium]|nr:DUF3078 domain-containing protein [Cyclobacteriaceae bacterium]HRJ80909.1 DUF3078 domain-containing protein [Cyclobacteriaceae bacterium]
MKRALTFGVVLLLCSILCTLSANAQVVKPDTTSNWKKKLLFNLNVNQASFSSNWKAGGINSIGLNSAFNYKANYSREKITWANEIDMLYGFVENSGQGFRKTLDRMFFDTKVGYKVSEKWDVFTSLNFMSQFTKGFRYNADDTEDLISDIFAPAFITSAWGLQYKPVDYFFVRMSPFAPRVTIVRDNNGRFDAVDPVRPYGVELGESTRFEWLAFQLTADFDKDIATNLNLKWRYLMFANYETLAAKTIDHRLDLMLTAKVNKFISVGLGGILLYDFDQDSGVQLSQAFNFGFRYSFQNYEEKK